MEGRTENANIETYSKGGVQLPIFTHEIAIGRRLCANFIYTNIYICYYMVNPESFI